MSAEANGFSHRLQTHNNALGKRSGVATFIGYKKYNWGGVSANVGASCEPGADPYCVLSARIDDLVSEKPYILKIDIEGHEPAAFKGAHRMLHALKPKHILMEYRARDDALVYTILAAGYTAINVREWDFFGQRGDDVFDIKNAPRGTVRLEHAVRLTAQNFDAFNRALAKRSCEIGCFTDLWFSLE